MSVTPIAECYDSWCLLQKKQVSKQPMGSQDAASQFFASTQKVFSKGLFDGFDRDTLIYIILFLLIGGVISGFFLWIRHKRLALVAKQAQEKEFRSIAHEYGMNEADIQLLVNITQAVGLSQPASIFSSIYVYERCIHDYIKPQTDQQNIKDPAIQSVMQELTSIRKKLGLDSIKSDLPIASSRMIDVGQTGSLQHELSHSVIIDKISVLQKNEVFLRLYYNAGLQNELNLLSKSSRFVFVFNRKDGIYSFFLTIEKILENGIECFHTLEFTRNQVRQHVRIETRIPIKITTIPNVKSSVSLQTKNTLRVFDGTSIDISGGGLSFISSAFFNPGEQVLLSFDLSDIRIRKIVGRIVKNDTIAKGTILKYKHHVQFIGIDDKVREQIIRHLFERQRFLMNVSAKRV